MTLDRTTSRQRIAIVLPPNSRFCATRPNSMETVIRTLLPHRSADEDVAIFSDVGSEDHGIDVPVIVTGSSSVRAMTKALKAFAPDIIEFHQNVIAATRISKHFPDALCVSYRHNALKGPKNLIDRIRYHHRYRKMGRFVFVSGSEQRIFIRDFPALAARACVMTNPINTAPWHAEVGVRDRQIVFSGRGIPEKGVAEVCTALPRIMDANPDWRAVLLLNDWEMHKGFAEPHVAPLRAYGERVDIMHSIPLDQVRQIMQRSDIALTPSLWEEPLGLTALEAHAAGVALVSSGRGGLREASGPHALYVDEVTPETLAHAVQSLIDDPVKRLELARAGQLFVNTEHAPQKRAGELTRLRQSLISGS